MFGKNTFWGLDLGGWSVKGAQLRRGAAGLEVVVADVTRLEGEPAVEASFGRDRRMWRALEDFRRRHPTRNQPLVISVPARATFIRPIQVMLVGGKSEEDLVRFEAQKHIPFGLDTLVWDYQLFPAVETAESSDAARQRDGLLVAIKKDALNSYLLSVAAGRMQATDVQCSPVALRNFVRYEYEEDDAQPHLIIDAGATRTDIVAVDGERFHIQTVVNGGEQMTKSLQERFSLTPEDAERVKGNVAGLKHARTVLEAMLPALRGYVSEARTAVGRFQAAMGRARFRKAYLFGAAAQTVGLERMLAESLECEVVVPRKLNKLRLSAELDAEQFAADLPALGVALGLALQGAGAAKCDMTLISAPALALRRASRYKPAAIAAVALLAVFAGLAIYLGHMRLKSAEDGWRQISQAVDPPYDRLQLWRKMEAENPGTLRLRGYEKLGASRAAFMAALNDIARLAGNNSGRDQSRKLWLMKIELAAGPNSIVGALEGAIDGQRLAAGKTLDEIVGEALMKSGNISNVRVTRQKNGVATLKWDTTAKGNFCLFRVEFAAAANKAEAPS